MQVFDASGTFNEARPSELKIGDSIIMISGSEARGAYSACLYVYVPEVETCFENALSAGAEEIEPPLDTPYMVIGGQW